MDETDKATLLLLGPNKREGKEEFRASEIEAISPIMHSQEKSTFANNAVSMGADIIRESSFMQY